ncbi:MAG: hypothetical protein JNK82_43745 [Myxococcaceae bacterium]|nr:hypothetical protein [Myxococcaceae bacterium]
MGVLKKVSLALLCCTAACGPNRTYPERLPYEPAPSQTLTCLPNLDGRIEASELQAAFGVPQSVLASPPNVRRTVDLNGVVDSAGRRVWDFATDFADDRVAKLEAAALQGQWFAASFPGGEYVAPLDLGGTVLGVYSEDGENLLLHGVASAVENPPEGKTLMPYLAPVALYRYPLELNKTWVSAGETRNATLRGLPYAGRDTYSTTIDQSGRLELPDLTFTQALRARTQITLEPAVGPSITRRQVSWLFECFGEVARAVSVDGETNDNFTTTSELRRLGL